MRSSGCTTVSRTSARIPSLRRRRRGRRVSAVCATPVSVIVSEVFVVIGLSAEVVGAAAFGRTELPAESGAMRAVGTEPPATARTWLQPRLFLGLPASDAHLFISFAHAALEISCLKCCFSVILSTRWMVCTILDDRPGDSYNPGPLLGGVAQMVRAGVS